MNVPETITAVRPAGQLLNGSFQGSRKDFRRPLDYIEQKKIRPELDRTFRLPAFRQAQTELKASKSIGKLVVAPDSPWEEKGAAYAGD